MLSAVTLVENPMSVEVSGEGGTPTFVLLSGRAKMPSKYLCVAIDWGWSQMFLFAVRSRRWRSSRIRDC